MIKVGKSWSSRVWQVGWLVLPLQSGASGHLKKGRGESTQTYLKSQFGDVSRWHICYLPLPWCLGQISWWILYLLHVEMIQILNLCCRWGWNHPDIFCLRAAKTGVSSHWWSRNSRMGNWMITGWHFCLASMAILCWQMGVSLNGGTAKMFFWDPLMRGIVT